MSVEPVRMLENLTRTTLVNDLGELDQLTRTNGTASAIEQRKQAIDAVKPRLTARTHPSPNPSKRLVNFVVVSAIRDRGC